MRVTFRREYDENNAIVIFTYDTKELGHLSGGSRILKKGGSSVHVTVRIKRREARALGGCGTWGTCPPRKIFDFRLSEIAFGAVLG